MSIITKFLGDPNKRELQRMQALVDRINELEGEFEKLSDAELKGKTEEFKERLKQKTSPLPADVNERAFLSRRGGLDELLPETFAAAREAAKRTIGQRPFDVQLLAGITLHRGIVTEMKTGEGKTLAATMPLYLNALKGKGAHLVTVNDYLAALHAEWMGRIYHALGMTTGCIQQQGVSYLYDPQHKNIKTQAQENRAVTLEGPRRAARGPIESHSKGEDSISQRNIGVQNDDVEEGGKVKIEKGFLRPVERKEAYEADITYGTNNEFGFDYLRDNMAQSLDQRVQRERHFAIVDEVDSILIDEARTPLIISGPAQEATDQYYRFAKIVPKLEEGADYNIDEKMRAATLTDDGISKVEQELGVENLYAKGGIKMVHHLENALRARTLFKKDKDYVIKDGEVVIVDEFTGRLMFGRRYSDGLHQALEAKENVKIQQESITMATITFQNYFRLYKKLSGMTGTAKTEEEELANIYGLSVLEIPTHKPIARKDNQDKIYKNEAGKFKAVIEEIKRRTDIGQPVLVGTVSVEKNERLSQALIQAGIKHEILNAKNHSREAQIISQAGKLGAVTVATNMAGRGVDIMLGGNPPDQEQAAAVRKLGGLAVIGTERHESRRIDNQLRGRSGRQGDPGDSQFFISMDDDLMRIFGSERMKAVMSRLGVPDDTPIENRLISRSIESAQKKVEGHNFDARKHVVQYDDVINKHRAVIYGMRDEILAAHPPLTKGWSPDGDVGTGGSEAEKPPSNSLLIKEGANRDRILDMITEEVASVVNFHTSAVREDDWNLDEIYEVVDTIFPIRIEVRLKLEDIYEAVAKDEDKPTEGKSALIHYLIKLSRAEYEKMEQRFGSTEAGQAIAQGGGSKENPFRRIESSVLLRSIDTLWIEHIDAMDHLRQGIGLRGYGQRDPLVEYKREARTMFDQLLVSISRQVVYSIYKIGQLADSGLTMPPGTNLTQASFTGAQKTAEQGTGQFQEVTRTTLPQSGGDISSTVKRESAAVARFTKKTEGAKQAPVSRKAAKIGRNDPCPCGSGKKYKKCGMINAPEHKKNDISKFQHIDMSSVWQPSKSSN